MRYKFWWAIYTNYNTRPKRYRPATKHGDLMPRAIPGKYIKKMNKRG